MITSNKERKHQALATTLKAGGLAVIPTDTIYGLVARALDKKAVSRVYTVKGRKPEKPFIILISNKEELSDFGVKPTNEQAKLIERFWPGSVTLIFRCDQSLDYLHRGGSTLAFRLPNDKALTSLIEKTGPLIAPSANPEGAPSALNINIAKKYFSSKVDYYYDDGDLVSEPSTIIDLSHDEPKVIRGDQSILKSLN
jgi:L-threonylcarbamoyladenylate synthase